MKIYKGFMGYDFTEIEGKYTYGIKGYEIGGYIKSTKSISKS